MAVLAARRHRGRPAATVTTVQMALSLVYWEMTLRARHVRSSAGPVAAITAHDVERTVLVGDSDVFRPSRALARTVQRTLGVIASTGHLAVDEFPDQIAELVKPDPRNE